MIDFVYLRKFYSRNLILCYLIFLFKLYLTLNIYFYLIIFGLKKVFYKFKYYNDKNYKILFL